MIVRSEFLIPLTPEQAWPLLLDVRSIADCVPGGELTDVIDDRTFKGKVAARLGPVRVTFAGTAHFDAIDVATHTAVLKASGADVSGRGNAAAVSRFHLTGDGAGSKVDVETDLQLVGMIAQYGRASGLIAQLSKELVNEFATNLRRRIESNQSSKAPATSDPNLAAPGKATRSTASELSIVGLLWRAIVSRWRSRR